MRSRSLSLAAGLALAMLPPTARLGAQLGIAPNLDAPLPEQGSIAWCPAFQLAWDSLAEATGGDQVHLEDPPASAASLNTFEWEAEQVLPPRGVYAAAGKIGNGIAQTIRDDLAARFGPAAASMRLPVTGDNPDAWVAIGALLHRLEFTRPFHRSRSVPLLFRSGGEATEVAFFGTAGKATGDFPIRILEWRDPDTFSLLLSDRDRGHVLMTKGDRPESLAAGIALQRGLLSEPQTPPEGYLGTLCPGDSLRIPYLACDAETDFDEFKNKRVVIDGVPGHTIVDIYQTLDFELDETGARVKSVGGIGVDPFGSPPPPPKSITPRDFNLDRAFLLSLWRRDAELPYLAIWVADTAMMEAWKKAEGP